ncbi:hypothetical protein CRG98_014974 [Punica granatum]|uniref:Reverse transcriptase Ty1/copia-type domain-containing protein n=1 Tax=Punica granatum TaxID=22663 RepID=A0A2I0KA69_PUNGR|nr:hypothetical protein CRG98_014974 [Punica granatum]
MRSEMESMYTNQVWTLVDLPEGVNPIGCKWVFKKKIDMDGSVITFKGRLVAKGFRQVHGVDYDEIFSPVAMLKSIRILLAIAAYYDYEIWQIDVKTVFLNGRLLEDVYMTQPEELCAPEFHLVGARVRGAYATRLGSVHLPGDARRTHVRRSRHLLFTTRRSRAVEPPGSRGTSISEDARHRIYNREIETPKVDGMGRANETRARTSCLFSSVDRGVSDSLMPRIPGRLRNDKGDHPKPGKGQGALGHSSKGWAESSP